MDKYWKDCIKWTSFSLLAGITSWILLYLQYPSPSTLPILHFPENKDLLLQLSLDLSFDEQRFNKEPVQGKYTLHCTLRGKPRSHPKGMLYHISFDSFDLLDEKGWTLLSFTQEKNLSRYYQSDSRWTDEQRKKIFNAFHVETSQNDYSEDSSFFNQKYRLFISQKGVLEEIILSRPLKNTIHAQLQPLLFSSVVETLLTYSRALPPLFPSNQTLANNWTTKGYFLSPLLFHHRITRRYGSVIDIETKSAPDKDRSISPAPFYWSPPPNIQSPHSNWSFRWQYDEETKQISHLEFSLENSLTGSLLGKKQHSFCSLQGKALIFFEASSAL